MPSDPEALIILLETHGHAAYFGEEVTVLEHSLECAYFAEQACAAPTTIAAALLHDLGHLLHGLPEGIAADGHDTRHEELAAVYLAPFFGAAVLDPIRMHVAAKRYLCATDPGYFALLSPSSVESLALQGGPMSSTEVAAFLAQPHAAEAVMLRRWDDQAKIVGLAVPGARHYQPILAQAALLA